MFRFIKYFALSCILGLLALSVTMFMQAKPEFKFATFVRIDANPYYCDGLIRNYLGFGYYQVDSVDCQTERGSEMVSSKIVSAEHLRKYWAKDGENFGPAHQFVTSPNNVYFQRSGQFEKAYLHIIGSHPSH